MEIRLVVNGGEMKPGPTLSQKIGPLGLNLGKLISDVNKATIEFKGMKVPIILNIDTKTKNITVKTLTPSVSELLKKEMGTPKGSGVPNKLKIGNMPIETIIKVAKTKQKDMLVNGIKEAVISVLGTAKSVGLLIESKDPKEIIEEIKEGKYDQEIKSGNEKASEEKLDKLVKEFEKIKKTQDAYIKQKQQEAEEKAAAKAAAPTTTGATAGTAPVAAGVASAAGTASVAKAAEKKK